MQVAPLGAFDPMVGDNVLIYFDQDSKVARERWSSLPTLSRSDWLQLKIN
jgi:hypothetical protein